MISNAATIELEPHQIRGIETGVAKLRKFRLLYLRFWMRKGKTLTALHIAEKCLVNTPDARVLFVTELEPIPSIKSDFQMMQHAYGDLHFKLTVINFESLHKVENEKYNIIIVDEVHRISRYAKPAKVCLQLKKICYGKAVILLSATPTPESFSQYFHQFYISSFNPFYKYANFYKWAEDYVDVEVVNHHGIPSNVYDRGNINKIWPVISHLFVSVRPEEGGTVNPVNHHVLEVEMSGKAIEIYNALLKDKIYINENDEAVIANDGAELNSKLAQISSGTIRFDENIDGIIYNEGVIIDDSKAVFIKSQFAGRKIAILYRYIAEGIMLRNHFPNHTSDFNEFNNRTDLVYINQIRSARVGINLASADDLVMFNIEDSALSFIQGSARTQSMYRTDPVNVYWIFSKHGIEKEIYQKVNEKKQQFTDIQYEKYT